MIGRYRDGYRVARTLDGFGKLLKILGAVACGLIILAGLVAGQSMSNWSRGFGASASDSAAVTVGVFIYSAISGGLVGLIFWIVGTWFSAQGQILKAHLDSAVHSSPFLSDPERARVMSLSGGAHSAERFEEPSYSEAAMSPTAKAALAYGPGFVLAAFGFILGFVWLVVPAIFLISTPKENYFLRFHSLQSLILNVGIFAAGYFGEYSQVNGIWYGAWFAAAGVNLLLITKAFNNEIFKLPVVGDLTEHFLTEFGPDKN
ncbi:MAG: hypothetical protein ACK4S4_01065 [Pyrinomonadaceae bacterium]